MSRRAPLLTHVALLTLGALAVHWLRYLAGYGDDAEMALLQQGHAYVGALDVAAAGLVATAIVVLLRAMGRARRGRGAAPTAPRASFRRTWLLLAGALSTIYVAQELIEGQLSPGHASGWHGVVGHGGWTAFVFAVGIAAVAALALRGAGTAIERAARSALRRREAAVRPPRAPRPPRTDLPPLAALARHLAGRAPPSHAG
jgi:hypothetical protein